MSKFNQEIKQLRKKKQPANDQVIGEFCNEDVANIIKKTNKYNQECYSRNT